MQKSIWQSRGSISSYTEKKKPKKTEATEKVHINPIFDETKQRHEENI